MVSRTHFKAGLFVALMGACIGLATSHLAGEQAADRTGAVPFAQAAFAAGKVTKIDDPATGGYGYWLVSLPSNYTPSRKWPVIFCYHGLGMAPTVFPFQELTDDKGYIVVGMEYEDRNARVPEVEKNLPNLKRIHDLLIKRVELDEKLQFIGGVSQGGFRTSDYGEASLGTWAGMILLDAGRGADATSHDAQAPNFNGKPIYIGDGEKDDNLPGCKEAEAFYKKHGADVTLEVYPGLGHAVDVKSATLRQWLADHGPLKAVKANLAAADADEKSAKLGQAYLLYKSVVEDAGPGPIADKAKAAAETIASGADKALADADAALAQKKYAEGIKMLSAANVTYGGSQWAVKSEARMKEVSADPSIQSILAQAKIDAAADAAERQALAAEKQKNFKAAIADYEAYLTAYPKSHRIATIREHLAALKTDKAIQSSIATSQADSDCKAWLGLARGYIDNGASDKAKPYLEKVIAHYPGTDYAATAAKELAELK